PPPRRPRSRPARRAGPPTTAACPRGSRARRSWLELHAVVLDAGELQRLRPRALERPRDRLPRALAELARAVGGLVGRELDLGEQAALERQRQQRALQDFVRVRGLGPQVDLERAAGDLGAV